MLNQGINNSGMMWMFFYFLSLSIIILSHILSCLLPEPIGIKHTFMDEF